MNIEELSYTAGLMDGEGTITLSKQNKNSKFRAPIVSMSSTTIELIQYMKKTYGGYISKQKIYKKHHKQSWSWKLDYDRAIEFLRQVTPYMKEPEKVRRANLLLNHYKKVTPRNGKYKDEQVRKRLQFELLFFSGGPGGELNPAS